MLTQLDQNLTGIIISLLGASILFIILAFICINKINKHLKSLDGFATESTRTTMQMIQIMQELDKKNICKAINTVNTLMAFGENYYFCRQQKRKIPEFMFIETIKDLTGQELDNEIQRPKI